MNEELAEVIEMPRPRCEEQGHFPSTHPSLWGRTGKTVCGTCGAPIHVEVTEA